MVKKPSNIYRVPIEEIYFLSCVGNEIAQGGKDTFALAEGETPGEARISLRKSLAFADNYNDLPSEKRKWIKPFRFREGNIEKISDCEKRFVNRNGEYTCGVPVHDIEGHPDRKDESTNGNGEFGMCCIERYSIPCGIGCPYEN